MDEFFVRYLWRNEIKFEVLPDEDAYLGARHTGNLELEGNRKVESYLQRTLRRQVLRLISRVVFPDRSRFVLCDLLCCPRCRGELDLDADGMGCHSCSATYRFQSGGVPRLLVEDEQEGNTSSLRPVERSSGLPIEP